MKYKRLIILAAIAVLAISAAHYKAYADNMLAVNTSKKHILILHSYHKGYEWTDKIMHGIESILNENSNIIYDVEYMDAKKNVSNEYFERLYDLYKLKYKNKMYDVIIATDNEAFDFLLKHREDIFHDTPVFFCGVNNFKEYVLDGDDDYIGIEEEINLEDNIALILKLHPNVNRIVAIVDESVSGEAIEKMLEKTMPKHDNKVSYTIFKSSILNNLNQDVQSLNANDIIFYAATALMDENDKQLSLLESFKGVAKNVSVPIYSAWEHYLGNGIIGGMLSSGYRQGQKVANMTVERLRGKSLREISAGKDDTRQYMFDYTQLLRHNIKIKSLPPTEDIINRPTTLYYIDKSIVWVIVLTIFIILLMSNLSLLTNIKKRIQAEAALSESEERLRTLINGMPDVICFKDGQGKWMEANEAILDFFDLANIGYKGRTDKELSERSTIFNNNFVSLAESDESVWEHGTLMHFEETISIPGKPVKIFDIIKVPLFYQDGSRKGIIMIGRDITQRNMAEAALHEKEEILRATLNATTDGVLVVGNDRRIIDYNPLFLRMWRLPKHLVATCDNNLIVDYVAGQLDKPDEFKLWVEDCYSIAQSDFRVMFFKDGRVYEIFSEPLIKKGRAEGRVWSFRDITQRKMIEKELSESEERYRRLVELSPDAIYMSVNGNNIYANSAGAKLLGVDNPKELIGKPILGYVYYDYYDSANKKIKNNQDGKTILPLIEEKLIKRDGSIVDIEVASTSFEFKGKTALLSVVRDITERKKAEELRKRVEENSKLLSEALEYDKLKTEFFANISHEFRTPLNIILGAQQLFGFVLKDELAGEAKQKIYKYLKIMKQNCYRLLRLVNNLIDITRIDAGFFNIQLQNSNIVNVVEEITLSVAEYIENKGISLQFDTDVEEKFIACDSDKIERIILNLLSNATKFTEPGQSIEVIVEDKGEWVSISVKDTGIGIPKDKQEIIFERFRQVDKSFVRNHEGSGIGLSIVKSLVELHGGRVSLESKWEEGTKFTILLPVKVLPCEDTKRQEDVTYQSKIERINVEFSDIYL